MTPAAVDILTPEACLPIVDKIYELRPYWSRSGGMTEFYTLGISAYMEAQLRGTIAYTLAAKRQNPILRDLFGDLYERVQRGLSELLGEPLEYHGRLALPGFHIFLADPAFAAPICKIHIDIPYSHLDWRDYEQVDPTKTISFTLALKLPSSGAGLNVWPQIPVEDAMNAARTPEEQVRGMTPDFHRYTPGRMVVHHGHAIHQIAPFTVNGKDEARITLQGHAIHSPRGWLAYF